MWKQKQKHFVVHFLAVTAWNLISRFVEDLLVINIYSTNND